MTIEIIHGDCLEVLPTLEIESFSACCCDPPYGLNFMSRHWDVADNVAFRPETWAAVYRVLKPGAHLLAFGGTRTYHRLVCAIEDAGFEIRDCIMWLTGQGFPKNLDVSKQLDLQGENYWFNVSKALDSLDCSDILSAWLEHSKTAPSAAVRFAKSRTGIGTSTRKNDSAHDPVLLSVSRESSCASAIIAELNLSAAHLMTEVSSAFVPEPAGEASMASSGHATIAVSLPANLAATQATINSFVQSGAWGSPSASTSHMDKAVEALKIWLGSKPSSRQEATSALCAALTDALKLITLSQSETFRNSGTSFQTACASATTATITESTAASLISFTVDTLRAEALNRATDAARQWHGWGTALKPACEPIVVARKPSAAVSSDELQGLTGWDHWCSSRSDGEDKILTGRALHPGARSYRARIDKNGVVVSREDLGAYEPFAVDAIAANVLRHGTGAINIDASRVPAGDGDIAGWHKTPQTNGQTSAGFLEGFNDRASPKDASGRWPANVCHDGSPEVLAAFAKFGESTSSGGSGPASKEWAGNGHTVGAYISAATGGLGDTGTAARFFKECRQEPEERGRRPGGFYNIGAPKGDSAKNGPSYLDGGSPSRFFFCGKATADERCDSKHPTQKPAALMEWLVGMVTPSDGRVLDPFAGTGSTLVACDRLGFDALGIEQDAQTVADAHEKLRRFRARRAIGRVDNRFAPIEGQMDLPL